MSAVSIQPGNTALTWMLSFAQAVASARVNVQAPTITSVHATALGATQAVVSWTTDLGATSRVRFWADGGPIVNADSSGSTTQHAVLLTGLHAATTYRYDVESATPVGDVSRDSLDGQHHSFTTRPAGSIAREGRLQAPGPALSPSALPEPPSSTQDAPSHSRA